MLEDAGDGTLVDQLQPSEIELPPQISFSCIACWGLHAFVVVPAHRLEVACSVRDHI